MKTIFKQILTTGFIAGLLDGLAAVIFLGKMNAERVFKFISSGIFGEKAFTGGYEMILYGALLHFLIAISFAAFYYFIMNRIISFTNNKIIKGLIYGLFIWGFMNLIILPLSNTPQFPLNFIGALKGIVIIILCVGLPISLLTKPQNKLVPKDL
ncbi:DUF1440 domain-containing protein [Flavobacterium pedocola]